MNFFTFSLPSLCANIFKKIILLKIEKTLKRLIYFFYQSTYAYIHNQYQLFQNKNHRVNPNRITCLTSLVSTLITQRIVMKFERSVIALI